MSRRSSISGPVHTYLLTRPNEDVSVEEIAKAVDVDRIKIQNALSTLRRGAVNIVTVTRGSVYRLSTAPVSNGKQNARMFEELATAHDGRLVLKCEDGKIYLAQEI